MKRLLFGLLVSIGIAALSGVPSEAASCTATGYVRDGIDLTAALLNPGATVAWPVNATGCNIGIYYDSNGAGGTVKNAEVYGANYYGVVVNGDAGPVSVDVINTSIHDIGESPLNGSQHGVGIYYRAFFLDGSATGKVSGNTFERYQKGGIVVNGVGANVVVSNNVVSGEGHVSYIAQNGIQFGYGSSGSAMKNAVTGHSYTGTSTASGGIIVIGGECYGGPLTTGIQIVQNLVEDNDIGIWLSNVEADCASAPGSQTNVKVVNNTISSDGLYNNYGGFGYQAGVADQGDNDKIINNRISGNGYDPAVNPSAYTVHIDEDSSFTNRAKVHANK